MSFTLIFCLVDYVGNIGHRTVKIETTVPVCSFEEIVVLGRINGNQ